MSKNKEEGKGKIETPPLMNTDPLMAHQVEMLAHLEAERGKVNDPEMLRRILELVLENGGESHPDVMLAHGWHEGKYPYVNAMKSKTYLDELFDLQIELLKLQTWVKATGQKVMVIFEGRDAAGKGGTIQRFTENLNPRGARIVALPKPTPTEAGQWYFQRYTAQLPARGEMVFFDRSWNNRGGVERVMGFCSEAEYREFLLEVPYFEVAVARSGVILIKLWLSVSQAEQQKRFKERAEHPLKRWKLSPIDLASVDKWDDYTRAYRTLFAATDLDTAPWVVVRSDDKKRARLNAIRYVLSCIPYDQKDPKKIGDIDPLIVGRARDMMRLDESLRLEKKK